MKEQLLLRMNQPGLQPLSAIGLPPVPSSQTVKTEPSIAQGGDLTIERGKRVSLLLLETISSKNLKVGDRVHFRVTDPIIIDHLVVVPRKAEAWGIVTAIRPRGRRLRSANMSIAIKQVDLLNGKAASLSADREVRGHLSDRELYDLNRGLVQTFFLTLPVVPLMHGDEVVIPKGTEFHATFSESISLDRAEIERLQPPPESAASGPATLVFYNIDPNSASPAIWCGKVKLGNLARGSHYAIQLPAGKYWVRSDVKKSALRVMLEPGEKYFIRISSPLMVKGNNGNPASGIELVDHDVGEIQVPETKPLVSKHHQDFTEADLRADPSE